MKPWLLAARPKTLVAGIIPVVLGSALAFHEGSFQAAIFLCALVGALAIQVGTNYVNDASDFQKGADNADRLGPARMAATGQLTPRALYVGAGVSFVFAFAFGSYLIAIAGLPILWIGLASILFAVLYTAGPFPLAYLGLGDIFVLIFFGLVAVLGTVFAHMGTIPKIAIFTAFASGFHGVALIAVNNLRDIPTDIVAGKKTLAVRLGDRRSRIYVAILCFLPYLCWLPVYLASRSPWMLLPALSIPLALANARLVFATTDRRDFNSHLGRIAGMQLAFGALAALSLVVSR